MGHLGRFVKSLTSDVKYIGDRGCAEFVDIETSFLGLQNSILNPSEISIDAYYDTYANYFETLNYPEETFRITGTNLAKLIEDFC